MARYKKGFTLAEVLITLGIIGVVAAMTLPVLIADYKEKQNISAYKKIYSELAQINQLLDSEYGGSWTVACNDFEDKCFRDLFANRMNVLKKCDDSITEGCQASSTYLDNATNVNTININDYYPGFVTNSGYSVKFRFHLNGCVTVNDSSLPISDTDKLSCGWVQIDTNGLKKPNVAGKDIFFLNFYKNGRINGVNTIRPEDQETWDNSNYNTTISDADLKEDCYNGTGILCSALFLTK